MATDPFLGSIMMFAGNFAPLGWALCDGSLLPIAQYDALYALIGTTYGGDGQNTFALPDLRGRLPVHRGNTIPLGAAVGQESVTLTSATMPAHTHTLLASADPATSTSPAGSVLGQSASKPYRAGAPSTSLAASSVAVAGAGLPHSNLQPSLCVNFCIALEGIFPSRN